MIGTADQALTMEIRPAMTPQQLIREFGIRNLFHFTDLRNLDSIRQHGLLSWRELRARGISPAAPGGNDWSHDADERRSLDRYVHLCLFSEHPMEYVARQDGRIQQSTFLKISPDVLSIPGVLFTDGVANRSGVEPMDLAAAAAILDFEAIYRRLDWRDPAVQERRQTAKKYEVLVPNLVPVHFIS